MITVRGINASGVSSRGVSVAVQGINELVKFTKRIGKLEEMATLRFREINTQLKSEFKLKLKESMIQACRNRTIRKHGHEWIANTLDVIPGGGGRGTSSLQVIVKDKNTQKFAKIWDEGGVILPRYATHLAIPTTQLLKNSTFGLPLHYTNDLLPRQVLGLLHDKGIVTTTITLSGSTLGGSSGTFTGKLIVAKLRNPPLAPGEVAQRNPGQKVTYKQIGLYILASKVHVTPSYWARDGLKYFRSYAVDRLMQIGKANLAELKKDLVHGS